MGWQTICAFMMAALVLLMTPGQIMAIIASSTLQGGQRAGVRTVIGIGLGEAALIAATCMSIFVSTTLLSSLLPWASLAGAVYLFVLSLNTLRYHLRPLANESHPATSRPFLNGLIAALSNPTVLLFYTAFFMQFVNTSQPIAPQVTLLATLYFIMSIVFDLGCVLLAARVHLVGMPAKWLGQGAKLACAVVYFGTSVLALNNFLTP